jgi:hypothetical protein
MSAAVSHHASFRYLERVDAREPWPAERVLAAGVAGAALRGGRR